MLAAHFVFLRIAFEEDRTWFLLTFFIPPLGWVYAFRSDCQTPKLPAFCSILAVSGFAIYSYFTSPAVLAGDVDFLWNDRATKVAAATRVYKRVKRKDPLDSTVLVVHGLLNKEDSLDPYGQPFAISIFRNEIVVSQTGENPPKEHPDRRFYLVVQ